MSSKIEIKLQKALRDLLPLRGSSCHGYFIDYNLDPNILDLYTPAIAHSRTLFCPALLYRTLKGQITAVKHLSSIKENTICGTNEGYFFTQPPIPCALYQEIKLFNSHIELLSYQQIYYPQPITTICLALPQDYAIDQVYELEKLFPNAKIFSFIPNNTPFHILLNLKLSLCLSAQDYTLKIADGVVTLTMATRRYSTPFKDLTKRFIPFVRDRKKRPLLFKSPPKGYTSFNEILNIN